MSGIDRRRHSRYATSVPVGIQFPKGDHKEGWGRIENISAAGIMIETRYRLKVGDVLYVTFSLKDGIRFDNLRARAVRVVYEEGYYVAGISFDEVVDQETLKDVITSLAYDGGLTLIN